MWISYSFLPPKIALFIPDEPPIFLYLDLLLRPNSRILYFNGKFGVLEEGRKDATAALVFYLSLWPRLLGRVPRVERTCVRLKGAITPSETVRSLVLRLGQGTESL